jgi:hypothetical protein
MRTSRSLRAPDTEEGKRDARWIEHLHLLLWLVKDFTRHHALPIVGLLAAVPTLLLSMKVTWDSRKSMKDAFHNASACAWACANVTWMVRSLFFHDYSHVHAKVFFWLGAVVLSTYYGAMGLRALKRIFDDHRL